MKSQCQHLPTFISFEGIDGAGKSSHIDAVNEWLVGQGLQVVKTREPGGTELAEMLREWVLNRSMDTLTEALLVFAARRDHLVKVILPALGQGQTVLCDRFTDATFAYQGYGRGFDLQVLRTLESWVQTSEGHDSTDLVQPDLTFWFDVPPRLAAERLASARVADRFESESTSFFEKVRQGYADRAKDFPDRFVRIDSSQPFDQVRSDVLRQLAGAWKRAL